MTANEPVVILPAEWVGEVATPGRILRMGDLEIPVWSESLHVYVRRVSNDLSVIEITIARHDGLAQEEIEVENVETERYPLGPKEYWRAKMVGKYTYGPDGHLMTEEEFEADWAEDDE